MAIAGGCAVATAGDGDMDLDRSRGIVVAEDEALSGCSISAFDSSMFITVILSALGGVNAAVAVTKMFAAAATSSCGRSALPSVTSSS